MVGRLFTGSILMLALIGCDSPGFKAKAKSPAEVAKKEGSSQVAGQTTTTSAVTPLDPNAAQTPVVFTPGLSVSDAIAKACGIQPKGDKAIAPSFDFDSTTIGDVDRALLQEVAKCLTEGALRGKNVSLVGRADARGEDEYNMTLGGSRSDAVQRYLRDLGVARDHLRATSRGEMDATGKDEAGYAQDRRVDVQLMN